jgi:heptosyltransferase III
VSYGNYPDLSLVKKVLVVKLRQLGDVLLATPVFSALKQAMPQALIDAYIYREAEPMLEGHPSIHQLIGYERRKREGLISRLSNELSLLRRIRKEKYDLIINLTEGDRGTIAALASGASIRVGFDPKGKWQKKVFTHIVKHTPTPRHVVEKNLDAVRRIGIFPGLEERPLYFHVPEETLHALRMKIGEGFILIHPTSRWRYKCLPVQTMRSLAERLVQEGHRVVFTSGPDPIERKMVAEITTGLDVISLAGQISLKELGGLIQLSQMLVSVDSVPFHIASALKAPAIAMFGPTSELTWGPWQNPNARILTEAFSCRPCFQDGCGGSKYSDCLHTMRVEKILTAIEEMSQSLNSSPK